MPHERVWFITGCSTGFGRLLAEVALENGDRVAATARNPEVLRSLVSAYPGRAAAIACDVTSPESVETAVRDTVDTFGRLDVVVNNAGYGLVGAVEEISDAEARAQFDVNVFGALNVMRSTLPILRAQRSGHLLHITSVAGFRSRPAFGIYASSKFALEAIGEASAAEFAPLGIHTTIVEPGPFRTDWAGRSLAAAERKIADYDGTAGENHRWLQGINGEQPNDPRKAALAMLQVVEMEAPPLRLPLGPEAFAGIRAKLAEVGANLDAVESIGLPMGYDA